MVEDGGQKARGQVAGTAVVGGRYVRGRFAGSAAAVMTDRTAGRNALVIEAGTGECRGIVTYGAVLAGGDVR